MNKMCYTPWLFTLNSHVQGFIYSLMELVLPYFTSLKFTKQIFEMNDGGEIALDWLILPHRDNESTD